MLEARGTLFEVHASKHKCPAGISGRKQTTAIRLAPIAGCWPGTGKWQRSKADYQNGRLHLCAEALIRAAAEVCHRLGRQFLGPFLCQPVAGPSTAHPCTSEASG